jgi:hypothetical protein
MRDLIKKILKESLPEPTLTIKSSKNFGKINFCIDTKCKEHKVQVCYQGICFDIYIKDVMTQWWGLGASVKPSGMIASALFKAIPDEFLDEDGYLPVELERKKLDPELKKGKNGEFPVIVDAGNGVTVKIL